MFRGMNTRQIIMDCVAIALCVLTLAAVLALWHRLPEKVVTNFGFSGAPGKVSERRGILPLLGILALMTAMFSALLRIRAVYWHMNLPWTIPWGREGLVVAATKDFLCVTNLCITVDNVYLVYACIAGKLLPWLLWLPYVVLTAALVWFLLRMRKICKG